MPVFWYTAPVVSVIKKRQGGRLVFPSALFNSQSMFISGIALIFGIFLLRVFRHLKRSVSKSKSLDRTRRQASEYSKTCANPGGLTNGAAPFYFTQGQNNAAENGLYDPTAVFGANPSRQRGAEQLDVELLTLSRQIKAEIDTKIVALQLMIADADRILQEFRRLVPHNDAPHETLVQSPMLSQRPSVPDRMRILKQEETTFDPRNVKKSHAASDDPANPAHLKNIVVEDPFAESDFGFDRAMRDLDQLSSNIPTFNSMASLDAWDMPQNDTSNTLPVAASNHIADAESIPNAIPLHTGGTSTPPLPEWDMPMSYPIADYRNDVETAVRPNEPPSQGYGTPGGTPAGASESGKPGRRKKNYTNKLLTQSPPQIDTLMTGETVRKMGSRPHRATGQNAESSAQDELLAPPMIPQSPPPSAQTLLAEGAPFSPSETGLDKIAVRKAKRHQLHYLIEKGMSPKDIAAHLEMPVGEVELIFSLHKRLSGETAKTTRQPLADTPSQPPRIIAADNIAVTENADDQEANNSRDGEQVA